MFSKGLRPTILLYEVHTFLGPNHLLPGGGTGYTETLRVCVGGSGGGGRGELPNFFR